FPCKLVQAQPIPSAVSPRSTWGFFVMYDSSSKLTKRLFQTGRYAVTVSTTSTTHSCEVLTRSMTRVGPPGNRVRGVGESGGGGGCGCVACCGGLRRRGRCSWQRGPPKHATPDTSLSLFREGLWTGRPHARTGGQEKSGNSSFQRQEKERPRNSRTTDRQGNRQISFAMPTDRLSRTVRGNRRLPSVLSRYPRDDSAGPPRRSRIPIWAGLSSWRDKPTLAVEILARARAFQAYSRSGMPSRFPHPCATAGSYGNSRKPSIPPSSFSGSATMSSYRAKYRFGAAWLRASRTAQ